MKDEALLKASGALTGGIGGLADTCGSMIGASMILGSVCGRGRQDVEKGREKLGKSVRQAADFYHWFKGETGTVNCREIITRHGNGTFYNFGDPEQGKAAREAGVFDKCVALVQKIAAKAAEMLWDIIEEEKKG
ncbi:MAG: C_GCAxxG_C_C family protein [Dehalococcoidales bacterium]|nr:C_GCAxxG_C_C family protein [Dehalococcoidales bacterium]